MTGGSTKFPCLQSKTSKENSNMKRGIAREICYCSLMEAIKDQDAERIRLLSLPEDLGAVNFCSEFKVNFQKLARLV